MMLPRMHDSPIPMYRTSGFDSATATAPTDELFSWPSVTGAQFVPLSVVFHRPPPTAPKYASFGRPLTPDTAIDRPPRSGPMLRQRNAFTIAASRAPSAVVPCAARRGAGALTLKAAVAARNAKPTQKEDRRNVPGIMRLLL